MSETNFYARINSLQNELKAPKNQYNSFGKYKYRSAEDILEAVKPLNQKHNVFLTITDEVVLIGDRYYLKATARLIDCENNNNVLEVTAMARESLDKKGQDHSQITGTASSYARKYALNGLYLIDDTKDADTDEYQKQNNQQQNGQQQNGVDPLTEKLTVTFSQAMKKLGSAQAVYQALETNQANMKKLFNSNSKKQKEEALKRLEGLIA